MLKIFIGEIMIIKVVLHTIFMFFYLIFIIRIMGKREVGSLSVFDLAVYFTISDLITVCIIDKNVPVILSIVSVAVLCFLQILLSYITLKNKKIRDFFDGKKSIIINDGKIDFEVMRKQRYSIDDLYTQIRQLGIESVTLIRWAILENNGKLSIIRKDCMYHSYPDPLISDGLIIKENLKLANIDEKTLLEAINKTKAKSIKDVKLCILLNEKLTFFF